MIRPTLKDILSSQSKRKLFIHNDGDFMFFEEVSINNDRIFFNYFTFLFNELGTFCWMGNIDIFVLQSH